MQKLVDWLLDRRSAVIAVAVVSTALIPTISSAVIGLQWVWRGPSVAVGDALLASLIISILAIAANGPGGALPFVVAGCTSIAAGCIVGAILRATGGLTLAVQVVLLLSLAGIAAYTLFGSTSNAVFAEPMAQFAEALRVQGFAAEEIARVVALQPRLVGLFGLDIGLRLILALLIVRWLLGYARRSPIFGQEFRALRIGYVIGVPSALIAVLTLVTNATLAHNLFGIAVLAFVLQGLALAHARGHAADWNFTHYVPIYLICVVFGFSLMIMGTFSEGLLD